MLSLNDYYFENHSVLDFVDSNHHSGNMTQVSRFMLRPEVWEKIFDLFTDTFLRIKDKKRLNNFFDNFFSPTEKIMLSKRLAIAVLLAKGNDYASIKNTIRVTDGTISKVNLLLKSNRAGLRLAVEEILKRDAGKIFWQEISDMLDFPRKGGNWYEMGKRKFQRRRKIQDLKSGLS